MVHLEFVDSRYAAIAADYGEVRRPFKPVLRCAVVHSHSGHCSASARCCFLDAGSNVLYCTDKGLKGGCLSRSKKKDNFKPVKVGDYYPSEGQQKALERLGNALNHASPALAFQSCEVLFDCESTGIMMRVVDLVTQAFRTGDRIWAWTGVHGHIARIHCARLLRIAALRAFDAQVKNEQGVSIMSVEQREYSRTLEMGIKRIVAQARQRREIVLQAELRASWAVISSLKNERDVRDWIRDYGPDIAGLAAFASPTNPGAGFKPAVANLVALYDLMQRKRDRSLSRQIYLLGNIDFSVRKVEVGDVELVMSMVTNCKRWVTAVLCSCVVRKWLSEPERLSPEVYERCIDILKEVCSFRVFVFRSNWKVRCGGLWNVVSLYETSRVSDLRQRMGAIIQERKTLEQDVEVYGPLEMLDSFRSAQVYLETAEVFGTLLEKEVRDISAFIEMSRANINTGESEKEGKNYQAIIRRELSRVSDTFKEMSRHSEAIEEKLKEVTEVINSLRSMVLAQEKLGIDLRTPLQPIPNKIVNLPQMSLVDECFVGRLEELRMLREQLGDTNKAETVALVGPESMGKSWLAMRYAKIYMDQYDVVAYLQADNPSSVFISLISLAKDLHCEKCSDKETLDAVRRDLSQRPRVLMIYDNADYVSKPGEDEYGAMQEYKSLIFRAQGHVLLTSRSREWLDRATLFDVPSFSEAEASELLHDAGELEITEARRLAVELDCNPLAVKQAAALLKRKRFTVSDFMLDFRMKRTRNSSVASTVLDVFLEALTPEAKELMEMMALLNGSFISMDIVRGLKQKMTDVSLLSVLSDLRAAEFINVNQHGVMISRAFQGVAQRLCSEVSERQTAVSETLSEVSETQKNNDEGFMLNARPYLEKKELAKEGDVGIAKKVADRLEDFELIYEEHLMREKQVKDAEEVKVPAGELVQTYVDSACRFHRLKKKHDEEQAFRNAMQAAGDDLALRVKVLATQGKILSKAGGDMRIADDILTQAIVMTQGMEGELAEKDLADLFVSYALVKMLKGEDGTSRAFYLRALELRRRDPGAAKELVQVLANLAFFYQTSSLKDLNEAETLSMEALRLIRVDKDKQIGAIYQNLAIIYDERYQELRRANSRPGSARGELQVEMDSFLAKKHEFLMKTLDFRLQYHSTPRIDPDVAQLHASLADVFIERLQWDSAIEQLQKALEKIDSNSPMYQQVHRHKKAAEFYRDHPEISAERPGS